MFHHEDTLQHLTENIPPGEKSASVHYAVKEQFGFINHIAVAIYDDKTDMLKDHDLDSFENIDILRNIAGFHHEAVVNGTGYSHAFDALTRKRPYKKAWSNHNAYAMLQRLAGGQLCQRTYRQQRAGRKNSAKICRRSARLTRTFMVSLTSPATHHKRTVLITGCSSGIGQCVALGLKARGYTVIASARKAEDVFRLQTKDLTAIQLDLADPASIKRAVEETLHLGHGKIFALFNNGAYGQPGAVEDLSREVLRQQFETNLFGTVELTNRIIPIMRKQGYGRIIQNSSVLGLIALPYRGAYNASKFALEGITDTLRLELSGTGIAVSLIEPGPIESRFRKNAFLAYQQHIDARHSAHHDTYQKMENRLKKEGPAAPFTLPPEAVLKKVIHALESRRPRPRYYVTFPTYLFGVLRRLCSTRWLDKILFKISSNENK